MTAETFSSFDGQVLSYEMSGDTGPLVVLLHGFALSSGLNWTLSGMPAALQEHGYRSCALDARGHGRSAKPTDTKAYREGALVRDVQSLLDHLDASVCALVGYSMGADTALRTAAVDARVDCVVAGGVGGDLADPPDFDRSRAARRLRGESTPAHNLDEFLVSTVRALGADPKPLAALLEGLGRQASPAWDDIAASVLVVTGVDDEQSGSGAQLAGRMRHGESLVIPGDHMSAPLSQEFIAATLSFLRDRGE